MNALMKTWAKECRKEWKEFSKNTTADEEENFKEDFFRQKWEDLESEAYDLFIKS
jgi:hypothetical protein